MVNDMLNFITHDFDGLPVSQATQDTKIGKVFVPKGYVNLTAMCKAGGKLLGHWIALRSTKEFIQARSNELQIPVDSYHDRDSRQQDASKLP